MQGEWARGLAGQGGGLVALGRPDGATGDLLEAAQGFVDRLRVWKGVEEIGVDDGEICPQLEAVEVFAAYTFAEVEIWAGSERVELLSLLHIVLPRLQWQDGLR